MGGEATETRFTVVVTGWLEDEQFEDNVWVDATDADDAATKGLAKMETYWGSKIEVGDVHVYKGM